MSLEAVAFASGTNIGLVTQGIGPTSASWTKVEANSATATAASSVAFALANAGAIGEAVVVSVYASVAGDVTSVTDTVGNTYNLLKSETAGTLALYTYGALVTVPWTSSGGATPNTITANLSASITSILMFDHWSCVGGVQAFDTNVVAAQGTTANSTATLSVQYQNALVVCSAVGTNTSAPTAGAGFAMQTSGVQAATTAYGMEDQAVIATPNTSTGHIGINVTCAQTGITTGGGAYSTTAVAMVASCAPPSSSHTVCMFVQVNTALASAVLWQMSIGTAVSPSELEFAAGGLQLQIRWQTSGAKVCTNNTLLLGVWSFVAVTWQQVGATNYVSVFSKPCGAPTCSRTDLSGAGGSGPYAPTGCVIGNGITYNNTNSRASSLVAVGWSGSICGVKVWDNIALTQEEIERESEQIAPYKRQGLWAYWPLSAANDFVSQSPNVMALASLAGTGLTTVTGPPVPEYVRYPKRDRLKARAPANDAFFFGSD